MDTKTTKCPNCGAELEYDADREFLFCQYCGTKVIVGEHTKHTEHIIDEARIKEAESAQRIRELEIELESTRMAVDTASRNNPIAAIGRVIGFIIWVPLLLGTFASVMSDSDLKYNSVTELVVSCVMFVVVLIAGIILLFPHKKK